MTKVHSIAAEVHKPIGAGFRVKVFVLDLGMYINGMMVFPPDGEHEWSVYPPALRVFGNYKYMIEFNKKMALWTEIYEASVDAVKLWQSNDNSEDGYMMTSKPGEVDAVSGVNEDEPINLDDIEF